MALEQYSRLKQLDTIICSRDKDLFMVPGYHYQWECGAQHAVQPKLVSELGSLRLESAKKLRGDGMRFFYAQCLMGDNVDNIPGIPFYGPIKTFKTLETCNSIPELFNTVREAYRKHYGDIWGERLLETGRLLYMTKELNKDGTPILWEFPEE